MTQEEKIKELEILLDKTIKERDYYYNLYLKLNSYIIQK